MMTSKEESNHIRVIYSIYNKMNGRVYIGSTNNYERRKRQHIRKLNEGKHINKRLQEDWETWSFKNFSFGVVEKVSSEENLRVREYFRIEEFRKVADIYNVTCPLTEEHVPKANFCKGKRKEGSVYSLSKKSNK